MTDDKTKAEMARKEKWYDKKRQPVYHKEVCRSCGSDDIRKFTAGGFFRVQCRKCQAIHDTSIKQPYILTEELLETEHGHQAIRVVKPFREPGTDAPLSHEREQGSFRDPDKNYTIGEEDEW